MILWYPQLSARVISKLRTLLSSLTLHNGLLSNSKGWWRKTTALPAHCTWFWVHHFCFIQPCLLYIIAVLTLLLGDYEYCYCYGCLLDDVDWIGKTTKERRKLFTLTFLTVPKLILTRADSVIIPINEMNKIIRDLD